MKLFGFVLAMLLGVFAVNAVAQDVSVVETWADREGELVVTDFKLFNVNGNDCLMAAIESRTSMDLNILWGNNLTQGGMREWPWDASYGFQSVTKTTIDGEDRILLFTSGWKFPHGVLVVIEDPEDNMTQIRNDALMMPTEIYDGPNSLNVSASFNWDFSDRHFQIGVFRNDEVREGDLLREVVVHCNDYGMHSFDISSLDVDVKNRRVYALAKWQHPGTPDLLVADLATREGSTARLFDLPEIGRQTGNIEIIGDFCYVASWSGDPGIYVYRMNGEPYPFNDEGLPNWTLVQQYEDEFEAWCGVFWMTFANGKVYYAGSTHIGSADIGEDGTLTFDRGWDLDPTNRRSVATTKIVYHDGSLFFNGTVEGRVYSTCVMQVAVD